MAVAFVEVLTTHEVNVAARGRVDNMEIIKGKLPSISEPGIKIARSVMMRAKGELQQLE